MKLIEHLNEYLEFYSQEHALSSTQKLHSIINLHLKSLLYEDLPLNITILKKWKQDIIKKGYSYSFNNSVYHALNRILEFYHIYYNIENPLYLIGKFRNVHDFKKPLNYINLDTLTDILNVYKNKYTNFYLLAFYSGLRKGELLSLKRSNFLYLKNSIYVNSSMRKGNLTLSKCGDSSCGYVNIPSWLYDYFLSFIPKRGYIFKFSESSLERDLAKRIKSIGLKNLSIKDFRHSCAVFLLSHGFTLYEVKKHLRHSNITTTERYYADIYNNVLSKKVESLGICDVVRLNKKNVF